MWEALDHPNLVLLLDVFEDAEHLTLVTELMHGGDLFKRLRNAPNGRRDSRQPICRSDSRRRAYLHHHGVVQRPKLALLVEKPRSASCTT